MPNMSYCQFRNTLDDLKDCRNTMQGSSQYFQSRDDISDEEFESMDQLIKVCRQIVKMADDETHVFI